MAGIRGSYPLTYDSIYAIVIVQGVNGMAKHEVKLDGKLIVVDDCNPEVAKWLCQAGSLPTVDTGEYLAGWFDNLEGRAEIARGEYCQAIGVLPY
jgi:hypothetical protein